MTTALAWLFGISCVLSLVVTMGAVVFYLRKVVHRSALRDDLWACVVDRFDDGSYLLREQVISPDGGWVDGTRNIIARELNGNGQVPMGFRVRAHHVERGYYQFLFGSCR